MKSSIGIGLICVIISAFILCGSVSASTYYIGDKITIPGTNTATDSIYLYITGPNIPLQDIPTSDGGYVTTSTRPIGVKPDKTWLAEFYLANRFDAGAYTIYITAWPLEYSGGHYAIRDENKESATYTLILQGLSVSGNTDGTKITLDITGTQTQVQTPVKTASPSSPSPTATKPASSPLPLFAVITGLTTAIYLLRR